MNTTTATATIKHQTWIAAPLEEVYALIGSAAGWNRWFTSHCVLEARPGGRFEPEWRDFGPDRYTHRDAGRVINLDAPRHIAFEWMPAEGVRTRFTLDLRPEGRGTTVRLADHGYPVGTHAEVNAFANAAASWGEALTLLKFAAEHGLRYQSPGDAPVVPAPQATAASAAAGPAVVAAAPSNAADPVATRPARRRRGKAAPTA